MKRGHVPQISISDDSHHVTEAIGDMYGNMEFESRPLSIVGSPLNDQYQHPGDQYESKKSSKSRPSVSRTQYNERGSSFSGERRIQTSRNSSYGHDNGSSSP